MALLETVNLSYTYSPDSPFSKEAVKNINVSVSEGEVLGIIGHTGSGKSTLLQLFNGLLKPTSGTVLFNGKDIWLEPKKIKNIRSQIGLVFQYPEYQLFEETVYDDIAFGPKNMGLSGDELKTAVMDAVRTVGLKEELLKKAPFDLSGGEKRRAAIAGIMAMQPRIIVFDEPTAGLDPIGHDMIFDAVMKYRRENGATVIIVSHSMEDMARYADRILVMNDGETVMLDTVDKVFSNREELKKIGLNVPYITQVLSGLKSRGVNINSNIYTVDSAVKEILRILGKAGDTDV